MKQPIKSEMPAAIGRQAKATMARAQNYDELFAAVANISRHLIGHKLFTIMAVNAQANQVRRLYSSNSAAYPAGGAKQKQDTPWTRQVLRQGRVFIARNGEDIRANFSDHQVISRLGLQFVLNVPIRNGAQTIGTMNLLDSSHCYDRNDVEWGLILANLLAGPLAKSQ